MQVFAYKEIESTQLKAKELIKENQTPFIVSAESQKQGKGTKGRSWHSPSGGLYFTLAMELDFNLLKVDTVRFSEKSCLLVVEVLRDLLKKNFPDSKLEDLHVKPINDLYFREAKLAGVLLESLNKDQNSILFVGIGLNVEKINAQNIDREIISLQEILSPSEYSRYSNLEFANNLANSLLERLSSLKKQCFLN